MTTKQLDKIIKRKTEKIFDLMGKGKITLQENMEMYIKMIEAYRIKYPSQIQELFGRSPASGS